MLAATVGLGIRAYKLKQKKAAEDVTVETAIPVHAVPVQIGTVEDVVFITGAIEAGDRADVIAKIPTPGRLMEVMVKKGDQVSKNQVLARVDRDEVGSFYMPYLVRSPRNGIVATVMDDLGEMVTAAKPVAVIINLDEVKVITSVIQSDLARIAEGNSARVHVDAFPTCSTSSLIRRRRRSPSPTATTTCCPACSRGWNWWPASMTASRSFPKPRS